MFSRPERVSDHAEDVAGMSRSFAESAGKPKQKKAKSANKQSSSSKSMSKKSTAPPPNKPVELCEGGCLMHLLHCACKRRNANQQTEAQLPIAVPIAAGGDAHAPTPVLHAQHPSMCLSSAPAPTDATDLAS